MDSILLVYIKKEREKQFVYLSSPGSEVSIPCYGPSDRCQTFCGDLTSTTDYKKA
jgi:hypothetical protein